MTIWIPKISLNALAAHWAEYRALSALSESTAKQRFDLETQKGVLFLDQLRRNVGDDRFFKLMADFFAAHKAQPVAAQLFLDAAGVSFALPADTGGSMYKASDIRDRLSSAITRIRYQDRRRSQPLCGRATAKTFLPMARKRGPHPQGDFEVSDEELRTHDAFIFVGRAESNSVLARWQEKIGVQSTGGFVPHRRIRITASETEGLVFAAANPLDSHRMVLVLAGNSALQTVLLKKFDSNDTQ